MMLFLLVPLQCALWRRWRAPLSSRPTTRRQTAACTPIPKAVLCRRSTEAPTPAPSRRRRSRPTGRSCAWRPARDPRGQHLVQAARWEGGLEGTQPSKLSRLIGSRPTHSRRKNQPPGLPRHPLFHLWLRLMTPQISTRHHLRRLLSSHPVSENRKEDVSREEDAASTLRKSFRLSPLSHSLTPLFFLVLCHRSLPSSYVNNSKPKKRQLGYLRTLCFLRTLSKAFPPLPLGHYWGGEGWRARHTRPSTALLYILCFLYCLFCDSWWQKSCLDTHTPRSIVLKKKVYLFKNPTFVAYFSTKRMWRCFEANV